MPRKEIPPYDYHVWFKGTKKPIHMYGMHEDHIRWQTDPKVPVKVKRIFIKEEPIGKSEHLGPKGCKVNQPADYDKGFKVLRAVDRREWWTTRVYKEKIKGIIHRL